MMFKHTTLAACIIAAAVALALIWPSNRDDSDDPDLNPEECKFDCAWSYEPGDQESFLVKVCKLREEIWAIAGTVGVPRGIDPDCPTGVHTAHKPFVVNSPKATLPQWPVRHFVDLARIPIWAWRSNGGKPVDAREIREALKAVAALRAMGRNIKCLETDTGKVCRFPSALRLSYSYTVCEREDPGACTYLRTPILEWRVRVTSTAENCMDRHPAERCFEIYGDLSDEVDR
jgi:hypothetical protein